MSISKRIWSRPICLILTFSIVALSLPYLGLSPAAGEHTAAAEAAGVPAGTAALTSALKSLQKGAAEDIIPGSPQGNLGTFYEYFLSGDASLQQNAGNVIGPDLDMLRRLLDWYQANLEPLFESIGANTPAYTISDRGSGFYAERVEQYYNKDLYNAWSTPFSPPETWNELEPDIPQLIPPDKNDGDSLEDDGDKVTLDQYVGYSKGLIVPESGYGLLEQAFLDVLTPLWSSRSDARADFSTSYTSSLPIVAERAMYATGDLRGATAMRQSPSSTTHYFAEGYVVRDPGQSSDTFILLQNREDQAAHVTVTFFGNDGDPVPVAVEVPPHARQTVIALEHVYGEVSALVESDVPVSAERSVYLQGRLYGSTCEHGAEPATERFFAEGYVSQDFETYFTLFNPGDDPADIDFHFMRSDGAARNCSITVPAHSRRTLTASAYVSGEFSTRVTSSAAVAVERLVYAYGPRGDLIGATCSQGLSGLSRNRHFAEGYTSPGEFSTYYTLGNQGGSDAEVKLTFLTSGGEEKTCRLTVPAHSRGTVNAADHVSGEFSVAVESDTDIMVERALYATGKSSNGYMGATVDHGVESPATEGNFPEGSQRVEIGATTYLTLGNPDRENAAEVDITCTTADGFAYVHHVSVPPHSRSTINLGQSNHDRLVQDCYDYLEALFLREIAQQLVAASMYVDVTRIYYDRVIGDEAKGRDVATQWLQGYVDDMLPSQVEEFLAVVDALACNQIDLFDPVHTGGIQSWGVIQAFEGRAAFLANQLLHPCDYFNPDYGDQQWEADRRAQCALTYTWITDRAVVPAGAKLTLSTRYGAGDWQQVLTTPDCRNDYHGPNGEEVLFTTRTIRQHTTDLTGGRIATMWFDRWYWEVYGGAAMHAVSPDTDLLLVKFTVPGVDLNGVGEVGFKLDVAGTTFDPNGYYTNEDGKASGGSCTAKDADYTTFTGTVAGDPGSQGPIWYASSALYLRSGGPRAFDPTRTNNPVWNIGGQYYANASAWTASHHKGGDWHHTRQDTGLGQQDWWQDVWCGDMSGAHAAHTYEIKGYVHRDFRVELPDYSGYAVPPPSEAVIEYNGDFKGFSPSHANPACWFACDWGAGDTKGYQFNKYDGSDIKHYNGTLAIPGTRTGWFPEVPLNDSVKVHTTSTVYAYDHTHLDGSGWPSGHKAAFYCSGVFVYFQGYGRPDSWMGDLRGIIGPHGLNEICIPGTHDSGTSPINASSHVNGETGFDWHEYAGLIGGFLGSAEMETILLAMAEFGPVDFLLAILSGVVAGELIYDMDSKSGLATVQADWSRSQAVKIGQQLNEGIRYIDLRVVKEKDEHGGEYVLSHSMTGEHLDDVLGDVKNFHISNASEFVLLDVNKVFNEGSQTDYLFDHAAFIQYVKNKLGADCLIPRSTGSLKLDDLWQGKGRIVLFYCDHDTVSADADLWYHCARDSFDLGDYSQDPNASNASWVINPWPDTDSPDYLIDVWTGFARDHSSDLEKLRSEGCFFVMQSQMTDQSKSDPPQRNRSMVLGGLAWLARKHKHQFILGPILWAATQKAAGKSPDDVPVSLEGLAQESNPIFFDAVLKVTALHDFVLNDLNVVTCDFATDPLLPTGIPGQGQTLFDFASAVNMDRYDPGRQRQDVQTVRRSAHDTVGATAPAADWYLAEGCTAGGMETFVLVQNPGAEAAKVSVSFQTGAGEVAPEQLQGVPVEAGSRRTFKVNDFVPDAYDVSTRVEATVGEVVCERSMYGAGRSWAHDSVGVTAPAAEWYLAEGCTAGGMETWVLAQNPGEAAASVNVSFQTGAGEVAPEQLQGVPVEAGSRRTFKVNDFVPDASGVSTRVEAVAGEVVCERAVYGDGRSWAHDSVGVTAPATEWYLAEGCTAGGFETFVLVQNPGDAEAMVSVEYMTDFARLDAGTFAVPPGSRLTLRVNDTVATFEVSALVTSDNPVVVERAVYYRTPL